MWKRKSILWLLGLLVAGCADSPWFGHTKGSSASSQPEPYNLERALETHSLLGHRVEARWVEGPWGDPMRASTLMLLLRDEQTGSLISLEDRYELFVYGWHTSMGHGTASDGKIVHLEKGVYFNSSIRFNMPGHWDIFVQVYDGETLLDEFQFATRVP